MAAIVPIDTSEDMASKDEPETMSSVDAPEFVAPSMAGGKTQGTWITSGGWMNLGDKLWSPNRRYMLFMQEDQNLVLYKDWETSKRRPIWASDTWEKGATKLVLRRDGNLVLQNMLGIQMWETGTSGDHFVLTVKDDGRAVILGEGGKVEWESPVDI